MAKRKGGQDFLALIEIKNPFFGNPFVDTPFEIDNCWPKNVSYCDQNWTCLSPGVPLNQRIDDQIDVE